MTLIKNVIGFTLVILLTILVLMNRQDVDFVWSPIHPAYDVPAYALILGSLAIGFLLGGILVWLNAANIRKSRKKQKKQIAKLEKEIEDIAKKPANANPPSDFFPQITNKSS